MSWQIINSRRWINYARTDVKRGEPFALAYCLIERTGAPGRISLEMAPGWRNRVAADHLLFLEAAFQELSQMPARSAMETLLEVAGRPGELLQLASSGLAEYKGLPMPHEYGWMLRQV